MKSGIKGAVAGVLFTLLSAGVAFAAECCCKEPCKMECCDKEKAPPSTAPAAEHKH